MEFTADQRLEMHLSLKRALGDDVANTLMGHLPPGGWSDVAQAHAVDRRFDEVNRRFDDIDKRFDDVYRRFDDIEKKFDDVDKKFDDVYRRFDDVDKKFDDVNRRLDGLDRRMTFIATIGTAVGLALIAAQVQVILSIARL